MMIIVVMVMIRVLYDQNIDVDLVTTVATKQNIVE